MKKQLISLATTLLIASATISQTSNKDSITCLPNSQLKKAIEMIERSKVYEEEIVNLRQTMGLFRLSVINKDSIIGTMNEREKQYRIIMTNQSKELSNNQVMIANLERNVEMRAKIHRKTKKDTFVVALITFVGAFFIGASL